MTSKLILSILSQFFMSVTPIGSEVLNNSTVGQHSDTELVFIDDDLVGHKVKQNGTSFETGNRSRNH